MKNGKLLFACFILVSANLAGQEFDLVQFDHRNGLPQNSIYAIQEDSLGYIWVGTQQGVSRFNGKSFKTFHRFNTNKILSNEVRVIYSLGRNIWIGGNSGLARYDLIKGEFESSYKLPKSTGKGRTVTCIEYYQDSLLVGTNNGLFKLSHKGSKFIPINSFVGDSISYIIPIKGNTWIISCNSGSFGFNVSTNRRFILDSLEITSYAKNRDTIYIVDKQTSIKSINSNYSISLIKNLDFNVSSIAAYRGGILLGTKDSGLFAISKELKILDHNNDNIEIQNIFTDSRGLVWIGTYLDGLQLYNPQIGFFELYDNLIEGKKSVVRAFEELSDGSIAIGMDKAGLALLDSENNTRELVRSDKTILSLETHNNELWAGDASGNLSKVERDNQGNYFLSVKQENLGLIRSITSVKDSLLIVGSSRGIFKLELESTSTGEYSLTELDTTLNVYVIHKHRTDSIFFGTLGQGMYLLKLNNQKHKIDSIHRLYETNILTINALDNETLLVGTSELGLFSWKIDTNILDSLVDNAGKTSVIYGVVNDKNRLWLSTNNGIFGYIKDENKYLNLNFITNVQHNEFNAGAAFLDSKSNIYLGGLKGFNRFKTEEVLNFYHQPAQIFFEDVLIEPKDLSKMDSSSLVKNLVEINSSSFQGLKAYFNSPNYGLEDHRHYRVELLNGGEVIDVRQYHENEEHSFIFDFSFRRFPLTFLRSLDVELKVYTSDIQGDFENATSRSLNIRILRPWWGIPVLIILLAGSIPILIFSVRLVRNLRRSQYQTLSDQDSIENRHREKINRISRLSDIEEIIKTATEDLEDFYNLHEVHFYEYNFYKNELSNSTLKYQPSKQTLKHISTRVQPGKATKIVLNDELLEYPRIFPIPEKNNSFGIPLVLRQKRLWSTDNIKDDDILGLFVVKLRRGFTSYWSPEILNKSLVYIDNCAQPMVATMQNKIAEEAKSILDSVNITSNNHFEFYQQLEKRLVERLSLVERIQVEFCPFDTVDNQKKGNFDFNVHYRETAFLNVTAIYPEGINRWSMLLIRNCYELSIPYYLNKKLENAIKNLTSPFKLAEKEEKHIVSIFSLVDSFFKTTNVVIWNKRVVDNQFIFEPAFNEKNFSFDFTKIEPSRFNLNNELSIYNKKHEFGRFILGNTKFNSCIYVPLVINDNDTSLKSQLSGFIIIFSSRDNIELFEQDRVFLDLLSDKTSRYFPYKKLYDLKDSTAQAENIPLESILKEIVVQARNLIFADSIILFWYTEEGRDLEKKYTMTGNVSDEQLPKKIESLLKTKNTLIDQIIQNEIVWIENKRDFHNKIGKKLEKNSFFYREHLRSSVMVPISIGKVKWGVVFFNFKKETLHKIEENLYLIDSFSAIAARQIQSARLTELLKRKKNILEKEKDLETKLREEVELRFEDVEQKLNSILPRATSASFYLILSGINHDIRKLLKYQKKSIDKLDVFNKKLSEFERESLKNEKERLNLYISRISNLLKLFKYDEDDSTSDMSINDTIYQISSFFTVPDSLIEKDESHNKIDIIVENNLNMQEDEIHCNITEMSMIFYNLVTNAVEVLSEQTANLDKTIKIVLGADRKNFRLIFMDNGPGLLELTDKEIFEFGKTTKDEDGLGVGLYFVHNTITKKYEGSVEFKRLNNWTQFTLVIPKYKMIRG